MSDEQNTTPEKGKEEASTEQSVDGQPLDESDAKIAEFLAKSKRRQLGQVPRAGLNRDDVNQSGLNIGSLRPDPEDALASQESFPTQERSPKRAKTLQAELETPEADAPEADAPSIETEELTAIATEEPMAATQDVAFWADETVSLANETSQYKADYSQPISNPNYDDEPQFYAPPPVEPKETPELRKNQPGRQSQKTNSGKRGGWSFIKATYRTLGLLVFLAATVLVLINFSKPWLQVWLKDEKPAITLPSVSNLRAMPQNELMRLKNSAIRLAPFKDKRLASDPVPFEGGRPTELDQFRLRAIGEGVEVSGLLRLYEMPDKRQFLRLTDFEITAGYDLRVLISAHANPKTKEDLDSQGYVDLAALKGENGPQNYLLAKTFELNDFGTFVIYDQLFEIIYAISRL